MEIVLIYLYLIGLSPVTVSLELWEVIEEEIHFCQWQTNWGLIMVQICWSLFPWSIEPSVSCSFYVFSVGNDREENKIILFSCFYAFHSEELKLLENVTVILLLLCIMVGCFVMMVQVMLTQLISRAIKLDIRALILGILVALSMNPGQLPEIKNEYWPPLDQSNHLRASLCMQGCLWGQTGRKCSPKWLCITMCCFIYDFQLHLDDGYDQHEIKLSLRNLCP